MRAEIWVITGALALGCGSDQTGGGHGGSGGIDADSGGNAGIAGSSGVGNASGNAGAAGAEVCPGITPPTIVSELAGAVFPSPGDYQGGTTPLLDLSGPDPTWTWNDPHVLKVGSEYWMYASSTVFFDFPVRLYRLRSSDGLAFTRSPLEPILDPGPVGSWDAGGVETPSVVFFRGKYHLFYTAYPYEVDDPKYDVLDFGVGHATSCDGVSWTRVGTERLIAASGQSDTDPSNDWYAFVVGEPGAVVYKDALYVYFTAAGVNAKLGTSLQVIGLVTSDDGIGWSAPELVLEPDQSLYPRIVDPGPPIGGWVGYSTPNAIVQNGELHLFVDVAFDPDGSHWQQIRLHHARSPDGRTNWVQDAAPLASTGDFDWAVGEIRAPDALVDGTTLRLYFAGHELDGTPPDHFAIGMMTAPLLP